MKKSWSGGSEIESDCAQPLLRVKDSTPVLSSSELAATVTDCQTAQPTPECFICLLVALCVISGGMSFLCVACRFNPPLAQRLVLSLFFALKLNPQLVIFFPRTSHWSLQLNWGYTVYAVPNLTLCISDNIYNAVPLSENGFWHPFEFMQLE